MIIYIPDEGGFVYMFDQFKLHRLCFNLPSNSL